MIIGKIIVIIGGSGSLGNELIRKYMNTNNIINISRDETKHWKMEKKYGSKITNIICDINNTERLIQVLLRLQPNIIIIAAALKHIDKCEVNQKEAIQTNLNAVVNLLDKIDVFNNSFVNLETILYVSTDKACSPINTYGMCKALVENYMIERSLYTKNIKYVIVRYGNVLNSRGSIIPLLHHMGRENEFFSLTDENMTRFIMSLEKSVLLIEHAIENAPSGTIIIPKLNAMKVKDLFEIFAELYSKPIKITGRRLGEKINESLINETQSLKAVDTDNYYYIIPAFLMKIYNNINTKSFDYNSSQNIMEKKELHDLLDKLQLLNKNIDYDESFINVSLI